MPDDQQISDSIHSQLRSKRSAIALLPDDKQDAIYGLTFQRFIEPRLSRSGLTKEQLEQAKATYIKGLKGQKPEPLDFDKPPANSFLTSAAKGAGGTVAGVAAGIAGGTAGAVRAGSEVLSGSRDLTGLGEALVRPMERFAERGRDVAKEYSTLPNLAEFTGKMIPGLAGAEAAPVALETLTGTTGLTTLLEGSQMLPGSRAAKAATSGAGFDIGSGDQTSGKNAVGYAAFDLMSRPVGRLLAKAGGKYGSIIHDMVRSAIDSRRTVGKGEVVEVGKQAAEKAESKLVTKLAELFPDKAERVKKGEALESVYTPEDVNKALNATKPVKKVAKAAASAITTETDSMGIRWAKSADGKYRVSIPKSVEDKDIQKYAKGKLEEQAKIHSGIKAGANEPTVAEQEKKTEQEARASVEQNPATKGTVEVIEQLSGVKQQLKEAGLTAKAGEGTSAAAPGQVVKSNTDHEIGSAKHEIDKNKSILADKSVPEDQRKVAADNLRFWTEKHSELTKPKQDIFEYKINWDRYKDKGAEGVDLAKSNARHEVTIQAKEAADTIKASPTMSPEEKQKALQSIGDRAKHTLYKIKTEKVPEGFVSAKTRDAARKATEYATQTSTKTKETSEATQRAVATHSQEDPIIAQIDRSKELESTYKSKGRTTLYNGIVKAWTKQGHGDISKLNEMLSVALEKVGDKPKEVP
jgi:hypothetical protein